MGSLLFFVRLGDQRAAALLILLKKAVSRSPDKTGGQGDGEM